MQRGGIGKYNLPACTWSYMSTRCYMSMLNTVIIALDLRACHGTDFSRRDPSCSR